MELLLDDRGDGGGDVPIHVVEEVDPDHDGEGVAGVALGHRAIIGAVGFGRGAQFGRGLLT